MWSRRPRLSRITSVCELWSQQQVCGRAVVVVVAVLQLTAAASAMDSNASESKPLDDAAKAAAVGDGQKITFKASGAPFCVWEPTVPWQCVHSAAESASVTRLVSALCLC